MCRGAASSDWADGGLGAEPNGESGVDYLLTGMAVGVVVGLVVKVWLGTGKTGGEAASVGWASAGADGPASSGSAVVVWIGLVGVVGIATLMGVASATSILHMYSFLNQPDFSAVYLSFGWTSTAAHRQSVVIRHGKARIPLSFVHAAASS
ncbi:hypothetical protein V6N12_031992 [Hibiscus sabdariffa]|uniref:Uncharacterized protein n=1 Tax=Hibiscus sabdariffa TaxID=183260 RepID=A0ABR2BYR9_9ROSI